jgi:hypothetical protein
MPVNGMNVGADYSITYFDSNTGGLVDLGDVQTVKITAMKHDISSKPFNKPPRYGYIPDGFKIDFTITRTGAVLEDLMVAFAQNFDSGNVQGPGFLNQTINNPDGSVSRYQYTNFVVFLTDHGDISREKVVPLTLEGMASTKVKLA